MWCGVPRPQGLSWFSTDLVGQRRAGMGRDGAPSDPEKIPRMLKGAGSAFHNELFFLKNFNTLPKRVI